MINKEIIRIASNTSNVGLNNKYSHKISLKDKLCGDKITLELIVTKQKIVSMKYETESCVYCEASASLLAQKIKNLPVKVIKNELKKLKEDISKDINIDFSKKLIEFKFLINKNNIKRLNCILLPIDAVLKALN